MTIAEKATSWAEQIANNNAHGYSQVTRWGPDYDCSSLVISAYDFAGTKVKMKGASYTGNMYPIFRSCEFQDVTDRVDLVTGAGLKRGDVLLDPATHTVIYAGNGKVINARSSEGNSQIGDQSGNEIRIQSYWNFAVYVLRYAGVEPEEADEEMQEEILQANEEVTRRREFSLMRGDYPLLTTKLADIYTEATAALQCLLQLREIGEVTINGFYDTETYNAVLFTQKMYGLLEDGEAGPDTFYALLTDGDYYPERI